MQHPDPRYFRISEHFVLSDFLGNHSAYQRGYANIFEFDGNYELKLTNLQELCRAGLEPIMAQWGPLSVSYGYISPELSRRLVKYQDPDKPSHHRFDLGAAADICVHDFVQGKFNTVQDLSMHESVRSAPIALAMGIDYIDVPYSRLITYSESPYLCLAVSAFEVLRKNPRKAFYENRFQGKPKAKPDYRQYATEKARSRLLEELQNDGLAVPWEGKGYPTYHGGGFNQYHHRRVSRYTMVSDWLFDLNSISNGIKNIPAFNIPEVEDSFAAAGLVYDWLIASSGAKRLSITQGYLSHLNPGFKKNNDWRTSSISFCFVPPDCGKTKLEWITWAQLFGNTPDGVYFDVREHDILVEIDVNEVLDNHDLTS